MDIGTNNEASLQNMSSNNGNGPYASSVTSSRGRRRATNNAEVEISDTINSIRELRQSLLDPARRTNISPTTGYGRILKHGCSTIDTIINVTLSS